MVRQELRHSDFLAFLLDPSQNHNLGDVFLKHFLKNVLIETADPPVSTIDVDIADFREATVQREWRRIDILIHAATQKIICVIENKIDSGEHSDQLQRYQMIVNDEFPGYRYIFVFLTPEGDEPSDESYIPFDYGKIANLVDTVSQTHQSTLGPDVSILMDHYTTMLRRHIVSDSEIAKLCQKIFQRHQKALDLLFEHRPDLQWQLSEMLVDLIKKGHETAELELYYESKVYISFYPTEWGTVPAQLKHANWKMSYMPLFFQFVNLKDELRLRLYLITPDYPKPVVRAIHQLALEDSAVFKHTTKKLGGNRTQLYRKQFLRSQDYEDADFETLREKIEATWQKFLDNELPAIQKKLNQITWPSPEQVKG